MQDGGNCTNSLTNAVGNYSTPSLAAGMGQSIELHLLVCPCSKRKMALAVDTKLSRLIADGMKSVCTDPEVKRSNFLFNICTGSTASSQHDCSPAVRADRCIYVGLVGLHCDAITSSVPAANVGSAQCTLIRLPMSLI